MKKLLTPLCLASLAIFMSSCVYSLFPVYTEDTLVFLPELIGTWSTPGSTQEFMKFTAASKSDSSALSAAIARGLYQTDKAYFLQIREDHTDVIYLAHLAKIGNDLFLDLYPYNDVCSVQNDNYLPLHTFYKVQIKDKKLSIISFDLDKLNKLFEANMVRLRHEMVNGTVLITAQPSDMQKFLARYSQDQEVFENPETYVKLTL